MEKDQYGQLSYLVSIAAVGFIISTLGLGRTIIVYGAKKENVFSPAYALAVISSLITSIAAYVIFQNIAVSFFILGQIIYLLNDADLLSKSRYTQFSKYMLLRSILSVIFAIILYQILGINGIILGFAFASLLGIRGFYIFVRTKKINISSLKPKLGFMIYNWVSAIAGILFFSGDKLLIGTLFGFSILGNYQFAFQFFTLLLALPYTIFTYFMPQEAQGTRNKKLKIFSVGLACILALLSVLVMPYMIKIFFPNYHESLLPMQIMSTGIIPFTILSIQESQFLGKERSKVVLVGSFLTVGSYFSLIVLLGAVGGLIGLISAFLISAIIRIIFNIIVIRLNM